MSVVHNVSSHAFPQRGDPASCTNRSALPHRFPASEEVQVEEAKKTGEKMCTVEVPGKMVTLPDGKEVPETWTHQLHIFQSILEESHLRSIKERIPEQALEETQPLLAYPGLWWRRFGGSLDLLQDTAIKVFRLPASSGAVERVYSGLSFLEGGGKHNMSAETLKKRSVLYMNKDMM